MKRHELINYIILLTNELKVDRLMSVKRVYRESHIEYNKNKDTLNIRVNMSQRIKLEKLYSALRCLSDFS